MKRKLYNSLLAWKNDPDHKPLILEGARQVGKTWLLKEFGKNEYDNLVYINFQDSPDAQSIFSQNLNIKRIIGSLEAYTGKRIIAGKTLIFMDEIQEAPNGLNSLKYFCEDARNQDVVVAGSLLGITHRQGDRIQSARSTCYTCIRCHLKNSYGLREKKFWPIPFPASTGR